jgi:shikimate dehydrogenase
VSISGKTRLCCVIGDPIEHTLSPTIQNAAFEHLKLDFVFLAFKVKPSELESAMRGIRSLGIHGINLTMPHKKAVTKLLDELDHTAEVLSSVNTVLNRNGQLCGFNTDGIGAVTALKENGVTLSGKKALLLGAGSAAKSIALSLANEVEELFILNRTLEKATELKESIKQYSGKKVISNTLSPKAIQKYLQNSDILINATSAGMQPNVDQNLVAPEWLRPDLTVMDIVYSPIETRLAKEAKKVGARVISGVDMLIHQGAASFEIWTERKAPLDVMRKAALNRLATSGEGK